MPGGGRGCVSGTVPYHPAMRVHHPPRSVAVTYLQAIILGVLQGVTELFPVSSLGHSVILPALLGWDNVVAAQKANESFFLAFLVGMHVATALALGWFYRADWVRIVTALIASVRVRRIEGPDARLGWLLVVATIPAGLLGLLLEHTLRVVFATPLYAAIFLVAQRVHPAGRRAAATPVGDANSVRAGAGPREPRAGLETMSFAAAGVVGVAQVGALFAGISRSGITMVAGLLRGLDHEDAARFSFLLATPIILAAGVYKLPDLIGHNGDGVRGQVLVGSVAAAIAAYLRSGSSRAGTRPGRCFRSRPTASLPGWRDRDLPLRRPGSAPHGHRGVAPRGKRPRGRVGRAEHRDPGRRPGGRAAGRTAARRPRPRPTACGVVRHRSASTSAIAPGRARSSSWPGPAGSVSSRVGHRDDAQDAHVHLLGVEDRAGRRAHHRGPGDGGQVERVADVDDGREPAGHEQVGQARPRSPARTRPPRGSRRGRRS